MRRLFISLVALALALGVNVPPVAAHNDACSSGYFCVWPNVSYDDYVIGPQHEHFAGSNQDWDFFGIENDDDSVKNEESFRVRVFADNLYNNVEYCMTPDEWEDDIHTDRDNDGDSHWVYTTTSCGTDPRP